MTKKDLSGQSINLLKLVPLQNVEFEVEEDGRVILLKPKYQNPFLVKHLLPRMKRPYFKVKLDEVGSFFWLKCDGNRTVQEIGQLHKNNFGERVEPLFERIGQFLASLEKHKFIVFK